MNIVERILLVLALALSVWALVSSPSARPVPHVPPSVVSNRVARVRERVANVSISSNDFPLIVRDSFRYFPASSNSVDYVVFGGRVIRSGIPCEWGHITRLGSDCVVGTSFDGRRMFHLVPDEVPRPSSSAPVFMRLYDVK